MTPRTAWLVVIAGATSAAVCTLVDEPAALRAPFAVVLLLVLPGFALTRALFPAVRRDRAQDVALCVGLSLAVAVIGGSDLGAAGLLSADAWAILPAAVTLVAVVIAVRRRARLAPADDPRPRPRRMRPARAAGAVVAGILAVVAVGAAVALARTPLPVPGDRGYTVMAVAAGGEDDLVRVQLRSEEADARDFVLALSMGDRREERPVTLHPGQRLEVPVPAEGWSPIGVLTAELVDPADPEDAYRRVTVRVPVPPPAAPVAEPTGEWDLG